MHGESSFTTKLYQREIVSRSLPTRKVRQLYSDRRLINDLDIVNELGGHTGCVNALSWSKSGALLASGSDDQHLNIHKYQPEDSVAQFRLATTVATGHKANIFSVKFMPHSDDRTVITAAGDYEVRVFDLEYAGQTTEASAASTNATEGRRSRRRDIYDGVRYLSDGNTDCRVYRSHGDRVKRIVTESSPYLFLTCSEDGEVRQWDLRQPSSAYPAPRGGRGSSIDTSVPPPLISYKRFQLDLNTISCSASQPHYIALGGAHLHAFLHDRRMAGRDLLHEFGKPVSSSKGMSEAEEEAMNEATRCVRKFAPDGRRRMTRSESGHITACKISDARPNEMIVSWSGDHIYAFDLQGRDEDGLTPLRKSSGGQNKRKRNTNGSQTSLSQTARPSSRPRTEDAISNSNGEAALRIRYQNGQSEDIPLTSKRPLTEKEKTAQRIAKSTIKVRDSLLSLTFNSALSQSASLLSTIDEELREWSYPLDPSPDMVVVQQTLRRNRESTRRFVQAAGTVARVLGGKIQTASGVSPAMAAYTSIEPRSSDLPLVIKEQFTYDFLKAIALWLDSGIGRLIEGFTRPDSILPNTKAAARLPISESKASTEAVDEFLIPYLLGLAGESSIVDVETNQFEHDERRTIFETEKAAVLAFAQTVRIPFADLSSAVIMAEGEESIAAQNRETAIRFWAGKVGRGLLYNAARDSDEEFIRRAFGGAASLARDAGREEEGVEDVEVLDADGIVVDGANVDDLAESVRAARERNDNESDEDMDESSTLLRRSATVEDEDEEMHDASSDDDRDRQSSDSEPDEEDGVPNSGMPRFMYASAFERRRMRDKVGLGVSCSGSTRSYRGHCNVRTVKDVNYFGLDDEYIVSGSDDGHFFMWDRKTSELVNLLEGDGETVNVIQGHPYETMLAVSGIDHTVKIFSPDARAREVARMGEEIRAADASTFSSLAWPSRLGRRRVRRDTETASEPAMPAANQDDDDYVAATGLRSRKKMKDAYRIMNQNDLDRQGGNQDAFLTRSMLAELARRMRVVRAAGGQVGFAAANQDQAPGEVEGGENIERMILLGEDCRVQ